jgi:ABC-type lipoprotein release transport system permease subunit
VSGERRTWESARPVLAWFRLDARRRWRSLAVLALLIGFAAGTVLAAIAGARRGATAVERLQAQTLPAHAAVLPNEPGFDWDAVRALPDVEAVNTFAVTGYMVDGIPPELQEEIPRFPPADDDTMRTVERPVVLKGRLPDFDRPDEVVVSPKFTSSFAKDVGDTVTLRLATPAEMDAMLLENAQVDQPSGPVINATIVGVVRSGWYSEEIGAPGFVVPSPGLFATYEPNLLGAKRSGYVNALVRLRGGDAALPAFQRDLAELTGRNDIDVWNWADKARHYVDVTRFEANGLYLFGVAAAVAALFLVGQATSRYVGSTVIDLDVLRAMGMTQRQARRAAVLGPALAGVVGTGLGVAAAYLASRWFPVGSAALVEPAPGYDFDVVVLGLGAFAVVTAVVVGSWAAASLALRASRTPAPSRPSAVAGAVARASVPAPLAIGARFALEPGRGRTAVPVRPALFGAIVGVLGVVAALTMSNGVRDAAENLDRFGQTYRLETFLGYNSTDFGSAADALTAMADDPDVVAVNDTRTDVVQADGEAAIAVLTLDPIDAPIDTVVLAGRLPDRPGEVALGPRTARAAGLAIGDRFSAVGERGTEELTVTGIAFVPAASHNDYATGAWALAATYDSLFDGFKFHIGLVELRPGADPQTVAARLQEQAGVEVRPPLPPVEVAEVQQVRALPILLAIFLAVLALGAVGHALATAVRRRRNDFAVLRALGMTRRQVRIVVLSQAAVMTVVGLAIGVPLGVALGRTVWRHVADSTPLQYLPPAAGRTLLLVIPVALVTGLALAIRPSSRAVSMRIATVLRSE